MITAQRTLRTGLFILAIDAQAQGPPPCRTNAQALPEPLLRAADVMWAKRVWRTVDLRDDANAALGPSPDTSAACGSLFEVIRFCLLNEASMTAYHPGATGTDDRFTRVLRGHELDSLMARCSPADITGYRIKEDWIFEKQRSELLVRIIGLAPLVDLRGPDGDLRGQRVLFWLYWPECRRALAQWPAARLQPDGERPSYEALFRRRRFTSMVIQVSGMDDRTLGATLSGVDAVREAMRLERALRDREQDLWHY